MQALEKIENLVAGKTSFPVKRFFGKEFRQVFLVNLAAAAIAVAFNGTIWGARFAFSAENLVSCFLYSYSIGTLIFFAFRRLNQLAPPRARDESAIFRLLKVAATIFAATLAGITVARLPLGFVFENFASKGLVPSARNLVFSLSIAATFGFAFYFYEISQARLRAKERDEEKARRLATEAQLASLESRIHPHFLFNTLNSIAALVREDPILAEKTIEKISALLRYSLESSDKNLVPLNQEIEITRKYLDIERVRFGEKLSYEIFCEKQSEQANVPPLSLQALVENSIKHVAAKTSRKTEINISAARDGAAVTVRVSDGGEGFDLAALPDGGGLDILRKRLTLIFQNRAKLEAPEPGTVLVTIPLENTSGERI